MDLALNNLQRLICHKTQTTNQQTLFFFTPNIKKIGTPLSVLVICYGVDDDGHFLESPTF